jgi:LmbE family N-acetylglucosaminyl deacetylase
METSTQVLSGHSVLLVNAHPDDKIIEASLLYGRAVETDPDTSTHEYVATLGERTTINNYTGSQPTYPQDGCRASESLAMASYYGIRSVWQDAYPDGELDSFVEPLANNIFQRALAIGATALVSIGGLSDHPDHQAIGRATLIAGRLLAIFKGQALILQLHMKSPDSMTNDIVVAAASSASMRYALTGASYNGSQHHVIRADSIPHKPEELCQTVDGEFYASEQTIDDLEQYPIWQNAYYRVERLGALATSAFTTSCNVT